MQSNEIATLKQYSCRPSLQVNAMTKDNVLDKEQTKQLVPCR